MILPARYRVVSKCSFVIILNKEQRDWIYYIGLYYTTVI